jgi:hypothetical protein
VLLHPILVTLRVWPRVLHDRAKPETGGAPWSSLPNLLMVSSVSDFYPIIANGSCLSPADDLQMSATTLQLLGRFPARRRGTVLYLALEEPSELPSGPGGKPTESYRVGGGMVGYIACRGYKNGLPAYELVEHNQPYLHCPARGNFLIRTYMRGLGHSHISNKAGLPLFN